MRTILLLAALLASAGAWAQATPQREPNLDARRNQKIEHLHVEDSGNSIDEVRVGGETQSVRVQPKAGVPAYEIPPTDMARSRPADSREGFSGRKQRVWNLFQF